MMEKVIDLLREPGLPQGEDLNGDLRFLAHQKIITRKAIIRKVFNEIQDSLWNEYKTHAHEMPGTLVELGSGVWPLKVRYPQVLATDILPNNLSDMVVDAGHLPFDNNSVSGIFCQNSFHHFPDPERFFRECDRVLKVGGVVALVDPYFGPFASFVFKRIFPNETFNTRQPTWITPESDGPMVGANQALSYIVFFRDREKFEKLFPTLKIRYHSVLGNYVRYLLSGGLNFKCLIPGPFEFLFVLGEKLLRPLRHILGLHHIISIQKVK